MALAVCKHCGIAFDVISDCALKSTSDIRFCPFCGKPSQLDVSREIEEFVDEDDDEDDDTNTLLSAI